jgi:hypothetical protein
MQRSQPAHWWWPPGVVRKGLEVLHYGCKLELITGSAWTPQTKSFKAVVAFEVGELHLDLFALVARLLVFRRSHERASDIACVLVHVVHDPPMRHVRAALRFEGANLTVADRGEITKGMIGAHVTCRGQRLAGRTSVDVLLLVECEVGSGISSWRSSSSDFLSSQSVPSSFGMRSTSWPSLRSDSARNFVEPPAYLLGTLVQSGRSDRSWRR